LNHYLPESLAQINASKKIFLWLSGPLNQVLPFITNRQHKACHSLLARLFATIPEGYNFYYLQTILFKIRMYKNFEIGGAQFRKYDMARLKTSWRNSGRIL